MANHYMFNTIVQILRSNRAIEQDEERRDVPTQTILSLNQSKRANPDPLLLGVVKSYF